MCLRDFTKRRQNAVDNCIIFPIIRKQCDCDKSDVYMCVCLSIGRGCQTNVKIKKKLYVVRRLRCKIFTNPCKWRKNNFFLLLGYLLCFFRCRHKKLFMHQFFSPFFSISQHINPSKRNMFKTFDLFHSSISFAVCVLLVK